MLEALPDPDGLPFGETPTWRELADWMVGRRVLVVGDDAEQAATAFAVRGAASVQTYERSWNELDPERHGIFEIVYCDGLLDRAAEPLALLRTLRSMITLGGLLAIGATVLDDPERSEYLRFVPDGLPGDPGWRLIPGRLAFRWMLQASGFEVQAALGERPGPSDPLPLVSEYLSATAVNGRPG